MCLDLSAAAVAQASKKAQRALGGAAQGARTQASVAVAQRGLGGAALRVQEPPEMIDSQGMVHLPAIVIKSMGGLGFLEDSLFDGKKLRQMAAEGRTDAKGTNIFGYVAVADGGVLFCLQMLLLRDSGPRIRIWLTV